MGIYFLICALNLIIFTCVCCDNEAVINGRTGIFDFPKAVNQLNENHLNYLKGISLSDWQDLIDSANASVIQQIKLEEQLINAEITVKNDSILHIQLMDLLPNSKAKEDSMIAMNLLKASLYVYNRKCAPNGISGELCQSFMANKDLPPNTALFDACIKILQTSRDGHHPFRRLLPRNYSDGIHEMYSEYGLPSPFAISNKLTHETNSIASNEIIDEKQNTLALVQWAQFIEHDLSRPVVTSMVNGFPIKCCNEENYKLQPRHHHPACVPLHRMEEKHGRETCLNYVRSAITIGSKCTFGAVEQLNQATGYLDLSQVYGLTEMAQQHMRSYKDGQIKSIGEPHSYCVNVDQTSCFMAEFSIVIYTIFMKNHNKIASQLKSKHPDWNDDRLFVASRDINIDVYRRIVFENWLPSVLGDKTYKNIMNEPLNLDRKPIQISNFLVSNEFGVAASRFYLSMIPNSLKNIAVPLADGNLIDETISTLNDRIFNPDLMYTPEKFNDILETILHQRPMKMDSKYAENLLNKNNSNSIRTTRTDLLAIDIQRGRDHGLQSYVKYLQVCNNVVVTDWRDLENFIHKEDVNKLQAAYNHWAEIDLIVGGISEVPLSGSTIGPTFNCILAEQFSKIRQWQHAMSVNKDETPYLSKYKTFTVAELLCANSGLRFVQENVFKLVSLKNPLISCADHLKTLR